jgi:hypothetical protein
LQERQRQAKKKPTLLNDYAFGIVLDTTIILPKVSIQGIVQMVTQMSADDKRR